MNIFFDGKRLTRLAASIEALCGVRVCFLRDDGRILCDSGRRASFCTQIDARREGRARCVDCEARAVRLRSAGEGARFDRCHAGVCGAIVPILWATGRAPMAYLAAGPFLDDAPIEAQWQDVRARLDWFPGGTDALCEAFYELRRYAPDERDALAAILEAVADYARLSGMIQPAGESDLRRLERFLDEHYMEKLSLASISAQLHIGRTRLCALAKELSGGQTLFSMIAQRRIEAAKTMLIQSEQPISAIAESVGISDYNYFSKIFRTAVGVSPSEFRKCTRRDLDNMV